MKNRTHYWMLVFAVIAAFAPMTLAHAQWTRGYQSTLLGDGRVVRKGDTDFDARRVRLELERGDDGGDVNLVVSGGRAQESLTLVGRWSKASQDEPKLRFTRCDGRTANIEGTAEFSHKEGRLERITLSGRAGRNDVSVNFRTRSIGDNGPGPGNGNGNGNSGNDNIDRLNVRTTGSGTFSIGSDRWPLTAVRVDLQRGGTARITLSLTGRRDEVVTGRWVGKGEDIGLTIDDGLEGRLRTTRGSINRRLKTGGIDRLILAGQAGRDTVNISFRAD